MPAGELLKVSGLTEPDLPLLRAVIDSIPSRVSLVTPDHRYIYANREFLSFVRVELAGLIGRSAREVLGDEVYAAFAATAARITPDHAPRWEGWITFKTGGSRFIQVAMTPYAPGGGDLQAIFVFTRDLTDLKTREKELSESLDQLLRTESLHIAMVASSLDCIIVTDEEGVVVEFNPAAEATFGYSRRDAVGRNVVDLVAPPALRALEPTREGLFRRLVDDTIIGKRLLRDSLRADGQVFPVEITLTKVAMADRLLYMAHCRDLSHDVRQREELAASEAALKAAEQINTRIIQGALDAFILADDKGLIADFNPAAEALLGHRRQDAVGKVLSQLIVPPGQRDAHEAELKRYLLTGISKNLGRRLQLEALSAAGEIIPVEVTINEVLLPDRRLFVVHVRDQRPSRKAEAEIEQQRTRIHQIEKLSAMGSLLAGVAHELNNPLAILVAQAALLKEKATGEDVRQRAERIQAAADRAGRIIKSFLAMARQKPPSRENVNLNTIIGETLEMLAYGLRTAGIEVLRDLDPVLPNLALDGDMMRQVVANILLNAQQALVLADPPRRLIVRTRLGEDHARFEIEDNGPGVPTQVIERIFDPFFTTKPAGVGTGIGLAICRDIVLAHGGKLELVPRVTAGAMFRVTLPLSGQALETPGPEEHAAPKPDRILVVDDEKDVGESLGEILEALGASVVVTSSATEGLELVAREGFDRVFVDLRMPEMSGAAFLEKLADLRPALAARAVLMTGDTVRGPTTLLGGAAKTPVLEKPFSFTDVRAVLAAPSTK